MAHLTSNNILREPCDDVTVSVCGGNEVRDQTSSLLYHTPLMTNFFPVPSKTSRFTLLLYFDHLSLTHRHTPGHLDQAPPILSRHRKQWSTREQIQKISWRAGDCHFTLRHQFNWWYWLYMVCPGGGCCECLHVHHVGRISTDLCNFQGGTLWTPMTSTSGLAAHIAAAKYGPC